MCQTGMRLPLGGLLVVVAAAAVTTATTSLAARVPTTQIGQTAFEPGYGYGYAKPVATYPIGSSVAYCESYFRSFNPPAGTYLGIDGFEHPCP